MEDILVVDRKIEAAQLKHLVERFFGDMVKLVVDVRRRVVAVGGELHADAEQVLLGQGSRQQDLWGANYYPGTEPDECIEFTALINIRPSQQNFGMELADTSLRQTIKDIVFELVGRGEAQ